MAAPSASEEAQWSKVITSTDRGALVSLTAWLMLVGALMFLGIRLCIRVPWRKLLGLDDYMTIVATGFATIHTVAILLAVKYGLGRHVSDILENEGYVYLRLMSRAIYVAEIFLVIGVSCSKLSVSLLFVRLASGRRHVLPAWILSGVIVACGIASLIAVAASSPFLAAKLPQHPAPWPKSWIAIAAANVVLEVALFTYPLYLVWDLQMKMRSKITVIIGFALRLPCSAIAVVRLAALIGAAKYAPDISWTYVRPAIFTEIEIHYSLMAATIPCIHVFLKNLKTGYLSTTAEQYGADSSRGGTTTNDSYAMCSVSAGKTTNANEHLDMSEKTNHMELKTASGPILTDNNGDSHGTCSKPKEAVVTDGGWEIRPFGCGGSTTTKIAHSIHASDGSVTSDGSDRIIIKKTVDVHYGS